MKNVKRANNPLPSLDPQRGQRSFALENDRELEFHSLANLFPLIEGDAFDQLVADVRAHGVREPIWIFEGKLLDGRNRYRASRAASVPLRYRLFQGDDPVKFVLSLNMQRRHLDASQRAMISGRVANLTQGRPVEEKTGRSAGLFEEAPATSVVTQEQAAGLLNVSERMVRRAVKVQRDGVEELQRAVDAGDVALTLAEEISELSPDEQREIVARGEKEILQAAKEIHSRKAARRRGERVEKIRAATVTGDPGVSPCLYPVIYADPPWRYEHPPMGDSDRSIENHYETMALADICALPVGRWATPDAVLFLWITAPQTYHTAPAVLAAWGFEFKSEIVWDKAATSLGKWTRNRHEKLLIATRGRPILPPAELVPASIYQERRGDHSAKPDYFRKLIATQYPDLPRLEMFARHRGQRDLGGMFYAGDNGWHVWGNQAQAPEPFAGGHVGPSGALPLVGETPSEQTREASADDLDIPAFLRREKQGAAV